MKADNLGGGRRQTSQMEAWRLGSGSRAIKDGHDGAVWELADTGAVETGTRCLVRHAECRAWCSPADAQQTRVYWEFAKHDGKV